MPHYCRHCGSTLSEEVVDLGHQPPSNAYLSRSELSSSEVTYPLKVYVCTKCWLMQLPAHASSEELFTPDYAYFSSTSSSWCRHAENFVIDVVKRLSLDSESFVVEVASNDGYLLKHFLHRDIPCLGIEPTHATAEAACTIGIPTIERFFGNDLANDLQQADLIIANNVLAHVPDINDFVKGISTLLMPNGRASIEFPHLLRLLEGNQFDTIYHEHYSYFSLHTVQSIVTSVGLDIIDVEELPTHGGSLRIWLAHSGKFSISPAVFDLISQEKSKGLQSLSAFSQFQRSAIAAKNALLNFLLDLNSKDRSIFAYGAAAKGNTLLNYAGVRSDLLPFVLDNAESKQGKYLPGSHIPIKSPSSIDISDFDYCLLLPWNLIGEFKSILTSTTLVTAIPSILIHPNP